MSALTADQRETIRAHVAARIEEIRASLDRDTGDTSAVAPDNAIGRLTRLDAMQAGHVAEALRRQRLAELARLEQTLPRIDDEAFGVCGGCDAPVGVARLLARPDARLCVTCADRVERRL
jgi:DnaK suppressor protein